MSLTVPSPDDVDDIFLSCRYGDVEDIQQFVDRFGQDLLNEIRDDNGNTVLHMACANGHADALDLLLRFVSPSLLSARNGAGSTPLHWAALNSHLNIAKKVVLHPQGLGKDLIDIKNDAGRSPLGEAENVGWEEGAKWFVEVMNLDDTKDGEEATDEAVEVPDNVEVEIQDAEGRVAKMTLGPRSAGTSIKESSQS